MEQENESILAHGVGEAMKRRRVNRHPSDAPLIQNRGGSREASIPWCVPLPWNRLGLKHVHLQACMPQDNSRRQSIWTGANYACLEAHRKSSMTPIRVVLVRRKYNSLSRLDHEPFDDYRFLPAYQLAGDARNLIISTSPILKPTMVML